MSKAIPTEAMVEAFYKAYDASHEMQPREHNQAVYDGLVAALSEGQAQPVAWESPEEWELEQRAFHCNETWPFEDVRKLINDLWAQYCFAADPDIPQPVVPGEVRAQLDLIKHLAEYTTEKNWADKRLYIMQAVDRALSAQAVEVKGETEGWRPVETAQELCSDCPRVGYTTDETRCAPCPRRSTLLLREGE